MLFVIVIINIYILYISFAHITEIPGPNRKNPSNKHGSNNNGIAATIDADTNDILKTKQVKVTYTTDDEDLYGSAEDFDDSDLVPDSSSHSNNNVEIHKTGHSNILLNNVGGEHHGSSHNNNQHHHHQHNHHGNTVSGGNNMEYGAINSNSVGGITRKPPYFGSGGKTEVRGAAMDNNELTSGSAASQLLWLPKGNSWHIRNLFRLQLIVLLLPCLITLFGWHLL